MSRSMTKEDLEWRAKDDARTLAEAAAIKADAPRYKRAQKAAQEMAEEASVKAKALSSIAKHAPAARNRRR